MNFSLVFCSVCTQVRLPLVQNYSHKQRISKVLCKKHFNNVVRDANFKNMNTLYEAPLCPYQKTGIGVIIDLSTMIAIPKLAALKMEPQHGSKYKSILENYLFDILQLFKDYAKEENKMPKTLPNVEGGTRLQSTRANNMCMHHFVGLLSGIT